MTYGDRRKRADVQLIQRDFDGLESAFLSHAQKLNKKRQTQIAKRVEKVIDGLQKAHQDGDTEEVKGILASLKMPSSKEWYKLVDKLVNSSVNAGILRAHFELLRLKELYEFDEWEVISEGYDYDVVLPEEARKWLREYAYEVGVITEETVLNRIRTTLERGLDEGLSPKDAMQAVKDSAGTWMSDHHAETIARTETGKMYNAGRVARYLDPELNGFVEALQYDAIVDTRTTDLCEHLDGRIIAVTNNATIARFTPPNHFRCRATWIAVTKYEEWEDNFDTSEDPEKGFNFEAPLPKILKGKKEPLVQPKKRVDPSSITDPYKIRSLDDDDFKIAIRNVEDQGIKLAMIKERAEAMLVKDNGLVEVKGDFGYGNMYKGVTEGKSYFVANGKFYNFVDDGGLEWNKLDKQLQKAKTQEDFDKIIAQFRKKNGDDFVYADLIVKLEEAFGKANVSMTWKGLNAVEQTADASKLLKIKTPPRTANYKNATGLQQAITDAQAWLSKYIPSELAPKTGVKLKFKYANRRAYAQGQTGEMFFGPYEKNAGVVIHETAHIIHWNNKEVADLITAFFDKRTAGEAMGSYMGENTKKDHFYSPYIGRVYGWETRKLDKTTDNRFFGQEVLSMGVQAMYTDPAKFYKDDKEHFLFTYAILRGLF